MKKTDKSGSNAHNNRNNRAKKITASSKNTARKPTRTHPNRTDTAERRRQQRAARVGDKRSETYGENSQEIQWFPGHMTRTRRRIQSDLKLVDAVAEIIDARLPYSSRNPDLSEIIGGKPRVILMNKCDLADAKATKLWTDYFKLRGITAIELDCKTGKGINNFVGAVRSVLADKIRAWEEKGMKNRPIRVMIVGIPNVGKSTFINRISKTSKAKAEDRPGVTRGSQWFAIDKSFELLDTPGVLWPKFDDRLVGERLAFTGAVRDQIMDTEQLALRLLEFFKDYPNQTFLRRFDLSAEQLKDMTPHDLLEAIAKKRGMLISGGEPDTRRAADMLLDEFRSAKLGRVTLELPPRRDAAFGGGSSEHGHTAGETA